VTWDDMVTIEPYSNSTTHGVSAYGSVTARPDGSRIFALWIDNVNNIDHLPGSAPSSHWRADMLGNFVWKYSDDAGHTVSQAFPCFLDIPSCTCMAGLTGRGVYI